jgi:hypothetical protein
MPLRVNTALYSWTSCEFKIDNLILTPAGNPWNIVSLDFEQKRERKVVYSNRRSGRPRGKTRGKYSVPSFSMKMFRAQAFELKTYLSLKGVGSYGDADFNMMIQVSEPVPGAVPLTLVAEDCTWDGEKAAHEEGVDELLLEIEIGCLQMTENGLRLWSELVGLTGNG